MKQLNKENWELVKLGDVCEVIAGQSPESSFYNKNGDGTPFFQGKADFTDTYPEVRYYTQKVTKLAQENDILLSVRAPVGPTNICNVDSCIGRGLSAIRSKESTYFKYVYYHFKSIEKKLSNSGNGSTFSAITTSDVKNIQIPLPPITTQKYIAQILDKADALRKKDQQLLKYYDELAQSLFINLFGDPVKNEKGWEVKKLGELGSISSGGTPSRKIPEYYNGLINWVKTTEVNGSLITTTEESITELGLKNSSCKVYPKNSIVVAMYGQGKTRGQVGMLGIEATTNQACGVLQPTSSVNHTYVYNYLKFSYSELRALGRGGNQENLNGAMLKDFEILYPPIQLQNQFAQQIQNIEKQKEKVKAQMQTSEETFQALLQQVFA